MDKSITGENEQNGNEEKKKSLEDGEGNEEEVTKKIKQDVSKKLAEELAEALEQEGGVEEEQESEVEKPEDDKFAIDSIVSRMIR